VVVAATVLLLLFQLQSSSCSLKLLISFISLLQYILSTFFLAYMAPGLCYLAVNGGEFLTFANGLLKKNKPQQGSGMTEADLPVDGSAGQVIEDNPTAVEQQIDAACKPIWWYLTGFPIWCRIASIGKANMMTKLSNEGMGSASPQDISEEDIMIPNGTEFTIAIFFVIFGVIAVIAGVGSNIYAQLV
jgi:hypothetical protein